MKRYDIYAFIGYDYNGPYASWEHHEADEGSGQFILACEALAEIERLRGLVEAAYREGCSYAYDGSRLETRWLHSDARKSLTPPTTTPNP